MQRYYADVQTEVGRMTITIRGNSEQDALIRLNRCYNYRKLLRISDQPKEYVKMKISPSVSPVIPLFSSNRSTKKFLRGY